MKCFKTFFPTFINYLKCLLVCVYIIPFNRFIIIKDSKKGPNLQWVKVGVSDLYNVEIIEGLEIGDVVYILPSKSLFDYQERFKKRVEGSFSFG